jgi:hypothetical protein
MKYSNHLQSQHRTFCFIFFSLHYTVSGVKEHLIFPLVTFMIPEKKLKFYKEDNISIIYVSSDSQMARQKLEIIRV